MDIRHNRQAGFFLPEILVAMALLCIGLLALLSCLASAVSLNMAAAQRADAVRVAQEQLEIVKAMKFADVNSGTGQFARNGLLYTCQVVSRVRTDAPYLKDVTVTVSWMPQRSAGRTVEQVQITTAVLRR